MKTIRCLLMVISIIIGISANSQHNKTKYFRDCELRKTYFAHSGDTIIFSCDSIRLFNRNSFKYIQNAYAELYLNNKEFIANNDTSNRLFKSLYDEKCIAYEDLKNNFTEFKLKSEKQIQLNDSIIYQIKKQSIQTKNELETADSLIVSSIQKIDHVNSSLRKLKIKYAGFGFLGGLIGGLLLAVIN